MNNNHDISIQIQEFQTTFAKIKEEVALVIVGMDEVVTEVLFSIFAGGHVLLEGAPGLGKTLLVKSISKSLGLSFRRIQFTPDLMPSDITGTQIISTQEGGKKDFEFRPGPLFSHMVLADEINRATSKTQSALLEAMEERQVTVLNETYGLPSPFFVLATQNPLEQEGTYSLPEAQLDRFVMKLIVPSPSSRELKEILKRTTGREVHSIQPVLQVGQAHQQIMHMKQLVREVVMAEPLAEVLVRMISALTPKSEYSSDYVNQYVRYGPGPRGAQSIVMTSKVAALAEGRINLSFEDLRKSFNQCLRHRIILNFQAEADGVTTDDIINEVKNAQ